MDFSDTKGNPISQEFLLNQRDYQLKDNMLITEIALKSVKFQKVKSITIFVESNLTGADNTVIQSISLFGKHARKISRVEKVLE
jgi:hypothetical protein